MRIEKISPQDRAGKFTVRFDDGSSMRLYRQTVEDFGLFPGMELSQEDIQRLHAAAGEMSAKMRAVRIVSATDISKDALEKRLIQKGEQAADARQAVQWLEQLSLLDDAQTASAVVERCIRKGYGLSRAKQALYEKRVPKQYWEAALEDYPDQSEAIEAYLRQKLDKDADRGQIKKAVDALLRRGHSYSAVRRCLSGMKFESEEFPEDSF